MSAETLRGSRNLMTTQPPERYPGLQLFKPSPGWACWYILPEDGQTIVALGGEVAYGYETVDGGRADAVRLLPGDRATLVRSDLPHYLAEWRIERART